jgi:hypothetical protein
MRPGPKQARMEIELLFAALLAILPGVPQPMHGCIHRQHASIVEQIARASDRHGVPPAVLLVVGLLESHYGCAPGSGGCWGAPVDRAHRLTAGTPDHAAIALAHSFEVCGSWVGAVARFRCGLCRCPARVVHGYTPEYAARLIERMHRRAGLPPPAGLRRSILAQRPRARLLGAATRPSDARARP